jgi:hypothetical protein
VLMSRSSDVHVRGQVSSIMCYGMYSDNF